MTELTEEQSKTLEKIDDFLKKTEIHQNLPIVEELQAIKEELQTIKKLLETKEFPKIPEPLPFPEIPVIDLSEITDLLKKLAEKENEPIEITLKLE